MRDWLKHEQDLILRLLIYRTDGEITVKIFAKPGGLDGHRFMEFDRLKDRLDALGIWQGLTAKVTGIGKDIYKAVWQEAGEDPILISADVIIDKKGKPWVLELNPGFDSIGSTYIVAFPDMKNIIDTALNNVIRLASERMATKKKIGTGTIYPGQAAVLQTPADEAAPEGPSPASIKSTPQQQLIETIHSLTMSGTVTQPIPQNAQILLSETLFDEVDREHLKGLLGENSLVKIVSPKEARNAAINEKASKDNLVCIIGKEDYANKALWNSNHKEQTKAGLLILNEDLRADRYIYLEGVVGLARAIMTRDDTRIRAYLKLLFDKTEDVSDEALAGYLINDPAKFSQYIKFKPIMPIETEELLQHYKTMVENLLMAA